MSDFDRIMWVIEKNPLLRSTIAAITVLEHLPDRRRIEQRVDRATRRIVRLRQRVVWNPYSIAPPRWEVDPNFDLAYHLRFVGAGGDGGLADLIAFAEPMVMQSFDRARPLWEFVVVDGLAGGRAALITKIHHSITDGMGALKLMLELFDLEATDAGPTDLPVTPEPVVLNQRQRFRSTLYATSWSVRRELMRQGVELIDHIRQEPAEARRQTRELASFAARLASEGITALSPIMQARSLSSTVHTLAVPVAGLKAAAKLADGKLNDAYVAAVGHGLWLYHQRMGNEITLVRAGMPFSTRPRGDSSIGGNAFVPARCDLPIKFAHPVDAIRSTRAVISQQRSEPLFALLPPLASVASRLPRFVLTNIFTAALTGQDVNISNVAGVDVPIYFEGAQIEAQYPFGPLGGAAVNVTLLSYLGVSYVGVNLDSAAVTNKTLFVQSLQDGFDWIIAAASPPARVAPKARTKSATATTRTAKPRKVR